MKKRISLMEYVWLGVAAVSLGFFIDAQIRYGWHKARTFLLFVGIALLMYLWRRMIRKSEEEQQD